MSPKRYKYKSKPSYASQTSHIALQACIFEEKHMENGVKINLEKGFEYLFPLCREIVWIKKSEEKHKKFSRSMI